MAPRRAKRAPRGPQDPSVQFSNSPFSGQSAILRPTWCPRRPGRPPGGHFGPPGDRNLTPEGSFLDPPGPILHAPEGYFPTHARGHLAYKFLENWPGGMREAIKSADHRLR